MQTSDLLQILDKKFKIDDCAEKDWISLMNNMKQHLCQNFKQKQKGLVIDNSEEINLVYTATFASNHVLEKILATEMENILLIVHHPMNWVVEGEKHNRVPFFEELEDELLKKMQTRKISLYALHVPLDRNAEISTGVSLAKALDGEWLDDLQFYGYFDTYVGAVAKLPDNNILTLKNKIETVFDHEVALYKYGSDKINNGKVGFVGGGGLKTHCIEYLYEHGINTFVTGITMKTNYNQEAHDLARRYNINIIGGTHYSTEKFAMNDLAKWLDSNFDIGSLFIEETPDFGDIDL